MLTSPVDIQRGDVQWILLNSKPLYKEVLIGLAHLEQFWRKALGGGGSAGEPW